MELVKRLNWQLLINRTLTDYRIDCQKRSILVKKLALSVFGRRSLEIRSGFTGKSSPLGLFQCYIGVGFCILDAPRETRSFSPVSVVCAFDRTAQVLSVTNGVRCSLKRSLKAHQVRSTERLQRRSGVAAMFGSLAQCPTILANFLAHNLVCHLRDGINEHRRQL